MLAWLITNKYYITDSFLHLKQLLFESARTRNIDIVEYNNVDIMRLLKRENYSKPDFILFWNKDVKLAHYLENKGMKVFNSSESIKISDDKSLTYLKLQNTGIKQPKTFFSPLLYYNDVSEDEEFLDFVIGELGLPFVFKECAGSFGQQVSLVSSKEEFKRKIKATNFRPYLMQEFIKTSFGKDLRIYIVGDKCVAAMKRQNHNGDFRANIEVGGVGEAYKPNNKEIEMALCVAKNIGLRFCGVDLLFGDNNEPILCEVNSNAYFNELDKIANIKIENYIFDQILNDI